MVKYVKKVNPVSTHFRCVKFEPITKTKKRIFEKYKKKEGYLTKKTIIWVYLTFFFTCGVSKTSIFRDTLIV